MILQPRLNAVHLTCSTAARYGCFALCIINSYPQRVTHSDKGRRDVCTLEIYPSQMGKTNLFKKRTIWLNTDCPDKILIGEQVCSRHIESGEITFLPAHKTPLYHHRACLEMVFIYCPRWITLERSQYFRFHFPLPCHCNEGKQDSDDGFLVHCSILKLALKFTKVSA